MKQVVFIINNTFSAKGLSGGDSIWLNLLRYYFRQNKITILGTKETYLLIKTEQESLLKKITFQPTAALRKQLLPLHGLVNLGYHYLNRTIVGIKSTITYRAIFKKADCLYSASDFYPDFLPALIVKLFINRQIKWLAGFYLFAPAPWSSDNPYRSSLTSWLKGWFYYLWQKPAYWLIKQKADLVLVTSKPDQQAFITKTRPIDKVIVVKGFIDQTQIKQFQNNYPSIPFSQRKFQAVFMGRFHYQKGALLLIDVWKRVVEQNPTASLVMIGSGPLEESIKQKIAQYRLGRNIILTGYLSKENKYQIFRQSQLVLHPATYDSGGMSMAEGLAFGLPGVAFDLPALKTYYPSGVVKVKCFDSDLFAQKIIDLLNNSVQYQKVKQAALTLIKKEWQFSSQLKKLDLFS
jgi:glycosyltransferase involved in cell wall biosynthesis